MTTLLLLWVALVQTAGKPPASDAAPATATIRGRVTDKESGAPIARAIVHLTRRDAEEPRATRTDAEGRYEFTELPAGQYSGVVTPGEHRATHLMAPLDAQRRGLIVLKAGEVRDGVNVALARSLAITVRVVDEWGEPLSGVSLRVRSADDGSEYQLMRMTDDRGLLRVYQLPPGRYRVCAERNLMFSVGRTDAPDSPSRERFLRTCYPKAASEAQAELVELDKTDLDGVVIQMRLGRTLTISGTVVGSNGAVPQNPRVSLEKFEPNGHSLISVTVDAGGHFWVSNVQPGDYSITASTGGPDQPEQRQDLEVAFQPIVVESSDVNGVVVAMSKTVDVAGRFVAEDGNMPLPLPGSSGFYVLARLAGDELRGQGSSHSALADANRTFQLTRMYGKQRLDVMNIPRGWYVKSIRYAGKEIIDVPTEFKAGTDPSVLEIVLSNRGATIAGRVTDERGEPVRGARVLIVPADPARWGMFRDNVPSSPTGTFRVGPQRAGDYTVVAVGPSGAMPQPRDRARFAQLAAAGERITLGENEERVLDLTVVKLDLVR